MSHVESVVKTHRNGELIAKVASLWLRPDDYVLDVTYGRGAFWTELFVNDWPRLTLDTHDKAIDGVDFRFLPEADGSVDVVVFDPPYIAQGGRESSTRQDMLNRYGLMSVPKSVGSLEHLIAGGIWSASRVLRPQGRLIAKTMDYISSGKYVQGRQLVVETAEAAGLMQVDEFVHHSGTGPQPERRQIHSRRSHSFLCVFQKPKRPKPSALETWVYRGAFA